MKFSQNAGILSDIIHFGLVYYNKEYYTGRANLAGIAIDDYFKFYDIVKEKVEKNKIEVSEHLFPIFYMSKEFSNILSEYLWKSVDMLIATPKDLLDYVNNKRLFKKFIIDYVFDTLPSQKLEKIYEKDDETLLTAMSELNLPYSMKYGIYTLLVNFDYIINLLYDFLEKITPLIYELHNEQKKFIQHIIDTIDDDESLFVFKKIFGYNYSNKDSYSFSISLLDMTRMQTFQYGSHSTFLIGHLYRQVAQKEILYSGVTFRSFALNVAGNPVRFDIMMLMYENNIGYTTSQLAHILNTSITAMARHVRVLIEEKFIVLSRRVGREIYYSINQEYKEIISVKINQYLKTYY